MIFNVTLFGIFSDIAVDIDYKGDVLIDTTSFKLPDISGFEFSIPASTLYFPLSFNSGELSVEILTTQIERDTTSITVDTTTGIYADEYFWIGNEYIYIQNIVGNVLTIQRGQEGTIANRYKRIDEAGIKLYLTKYPVWLTGKLLKIERSDINIIQYAVLDKEPTFKDGLLSFSCSDLVKTLENNLPKISQKNEESESILLSSMMFELMNVPGLGYGSYDYMPEFFSFFDESLLTLFFFRNDILTFDTVIDLTKINSYKDLIEIAMKLSKSIIYLDKKTGRYKVKQLSPTLSFQTNSEIKMLDYMRSDGGYEIKKEENIKRITLSYNNKKNQAKNITFNITNILSGQELNINLSAFTNINSQGIFSALQRFVYDTGFIYSVVEIDSTELVLSTLNIGEIYKFNDVFIFSFQDITEYCMFLGSDGDVYKFAILKNYIKTLLSPAIPMKYKTSSEIEFGWLDSEFDYFRLPDFLNISGVQSLATIENAKFQLNDVSLIYFKVGDKVNVYDFENDLNNFATITDITDNVVAIDVSIGSNDYWLVYDVYANANMKQLKFFYLNVNNY